MTATCASPIVNRTCSPVSLRSSRAVGSSSSIRWRAGPILSRSPLDTGSIATTSVGSGTRSGQPERVLAVDSVSPVSVEESFATAPISPALRSPIGSCSLPWSSRSWPIRSSSPRARRSTRALAPERPGQDPQVRQAADERIGGRLEDADQERAVLVRPDSTSLPALSTAAYGRLLGRETGGSGRSRRAGRVEADALRAAGDEHRREHALAHALVEAGVELRVGDLLALEVLRQDVVVRLGCRLEQLVAATGDLAPRARPGWDLDFLEPSQPVRLAVDEVDVAAERVGSADRELERAILSRTPRRSASRAAVGVRVLAVALVDEEAGAVFVARPSRRPAPGRPRRRPRRP
jgi:hypothetical protein